MKNNRIMKTVQVKQGKKWIESYTDTNAKNVFESFACDLVAKKIDHADFVKSFRKTQNLYNGFYKYVVTYSNGVRAVYIINH